MTVDICIGCDDFNTLRSGRSYYVDKTSFLEELLSPVSAKVTIITRPHRFGKTLTMSMLAEFFDIRKKSKELFAGLTISENKALCKKWMNQYPVVFMSLKDIEGKDFPEAFAKFQYVIQSTCANYAELRTSPKVREEDRDWLIAIKDGTADEADLQGALATLTRALEAYYGKPAIVLIDEYDVPVAKALENGYHDDMIEFVRTFLGDALKGNKSLDFAILTGCLRISADIVCSAFNNFDCDGVGDSAYATMVGFSEADVDTLLIQAGLAHKKDEVRDWYGGYYLGQLQNIYNPWSILSYVQTFQNDPHAKPKAWWLDNRANELVKNLLSKRSFEKVSQRRIYDDRPSAWEIQKTFEAAQSKVPLLWAGMSIPVSVNEHPSYKTLYNSEANFWTLLYMTGYLTKTFDATKCIETPRKDETLLTIPNKEVREAFQQEIETWFENVLPKDRSVYYEAFWQADAKQFETLFSEVLLSSMSYHNKAQCRRDPDEIFYYGTLLGLFIPAHYQILFNQKKDEREADLFVGDPSNSRAAIIELKKSKTIEEVGSVVKTEGQQKTAQSDDNCLRHAEYRTILHWSIAFCEKQCKSKARLVEKP